MADKIKSKAETKMEKSEVKEQPKTESKAEAKAEVKKEEVKTETKKETPKVVKKDEAVALGKNLHVSLKQCMYICKFIKHNSIDEAIDKLEDVIKMKRAVPFKGEIPHRREKGMMSGRYPINASKIFIPLLKGLKGNILVNQMDLDKSKIYFASASWASRPSKRGGARFKRTNVILRAKEIQPKEAKK